MPDLQPNLPPTIPTEPVPQPPGPVDTKVEGNTMPGGADPNRTTDYSVSDTPMSFPAIPGYKIEQELGRGGMGVVYRARQVGLDRTVALKMILRADFAGAEQKLRFQIEAENAARVQHPNIVQVFEVGEFKGQPFFAQEFVDGGSLADWLKSHRMKPGEAAAFVETLARAMFAAHSQGIIHRDLKPGNILMASPGRESGEVIPKITDFGLAKRLDATDHLTGSGAVMGTPSYMAPEQARGDTKHVRPAADQYALGVIFYQLLTNRLPFEAESVPALLKKIIEDDPPAPTARNAAVPTDLSIICLKCLEKDPAKRYSTTEALAEDLKNWREHRPILARPATRLERVVKWCRRYPAVAALILVSTLAAIIASGLAAWALRAEAAAVANAELARANAAKATAERDAKSKALEAEQMAKEQARAMTTKALQALRSLTDRGMELQLTRGKFTKEDRAFLQNALEQYQAVALAEDEAFRAEGFGRVAMLQARLGDIPAATAAYREALQRYRKLASQWPAEVDVGRQLNVVMTNLANLLMQHGGAKEAEALHRESLVNRRTLAARHPMQAELQQEVAQGCLSLVGLLARQGRHSEAETLCAEAVAIWRQWVAAQPEQQQPVERLASALGIQAHLLMLQSKHPAARPVFEESIELRRRLLAQEPREPAYREGLAAALLNYGSMLLAQKQDAAAISPMRQAVEVYRQLAADFPAVPEYRRHLAGARNNLALSYKGAGQLKEAEAEQLVALEASRRAAEEFPGSPELQTDWGGACVNYAGLLVRENRDTEALQQAQLGYEVLSQVIQRFPEYAPAKTYFERARHTLKLAHGFLGKTAQAKGAHEQAVAAFEQAMNLASGPERDSLRWSRVFSLVHLQPTLAVAEAEALRGAAPSELVTVELARILSMALPRLDEAARNEATHRAILLFEELRREDFFRKHKDFAMSLRQDEQLKELRAQPQFRAAVPELATPLPPPRPPAR